VGGASQPVRATGTGRGPASLAILGTVFYVAAALAAFFSMPPKDLDVSSAWAAVLLLALAIVLLVILYVMSLRRIGRARYPLLRALVIVTVFLITYLLLMAYLYLSLESRFPGQVPGVVTHVDALYFTVTVLTTTGFGDISAAGQAAKAVVTVQMVFTLVVLGALLRSAATVGREERERRRQVRPGGSDGG
jgi:drug/metabolite transporter (DMT)-like permease